MKHILPIWPPLVLAGLNLAAALTIHMVFVFGLVLAVLDANARYVEYRQLRFLLRSNKEFFGVDMPINGGAVGSQVKRMLKSWCGRNADYYALTHEGLNGSMVYANHRWYHVFPDGTPRVFFKKSFWINVIGLRP